MQNHGFVQKTHLGLKESTQDHEVVIFLKGVLFTQKMGLYSRL